MTPQRTASRDHASPTRRRTPSATHGAPAASQQAHPGVQLQRSLGNSALQRLLRSSQIQTKLNVSSPHDQSEREAERVADNVSRPAPHSPTTPAVVHRQEKAAGDQVDRAGSGASSTSSPALSALPAKGSGEQINPATRGKLESHLGTDLSGVRVHSDGAAHKAADALNARAFTHQKDIWLGRGESQSDTKLMAHEATHVVQQTGSVQRQLVQRATGSSGKYDFKEKGQVRKKGASFALSIPELKIPTFKVDVTDPKVTLPKKTDKPRPDDQREIWEQHAQTGGALDTQLDKKLKDADPPKTIQGSQPVYFLQITGSSSGKPFFVIGNRTTIKKRLLRPSWDKNGHLEFYQVDHMQELQLGGKNKIENMWLLEADANQSSGRNIRAEKDRRIGALLTAATGTVWKTTPDVDKARREYDITFETIKGGLGVDGKPNKRWTLKEIKAGLQLETLNFLTEKEIQSKGLRGSPSKVVVYTNEAGGGKRQSDGWKDGDKEKAIDWNYGAVLRATRLKYNKNTKRGTLHVVAFDGSKIIKKTHLAFDIQEMAGVAYGGYVSKVSVKREMADKLEAVGLSPIHLGDIDFTDAGLIARGTLIPKPTIPVLNKLDIDVVFNGNDIYLSKVLTAGDFTFPSPITVSNALLKIYVGTQGIGATGNVFIEVARVGRGKLTGCVSTRDGFMIEGVFDFDSSLFDPARVHLKYMKGQFSGGGDIGIKPDKVRGIRSATATVSFDHNTIDAKGSIKPDVPAVEQADLTMHYSAADGLVIGGDLQLKKNIPGISGGSLHAQVTKKPGSDRYVLKASGEVTPKIPGISSKLVATYDDGAFDAVATASYAKGMLKGSVTVGATNRPVSKDGKPTGPPAEHSKTVTFYGGGLVSLRLTPWLEGTAAIKFRDNDVEVTGKIGLPATVNIFDEKKVDKNLFTIGVDIPVVGVSVLGKRIGIFLNISGGLDLTAGIGPGQLQGVNVSVTYNPAREEDTKVTGHAALYIPAHAGLRLFVRGALGAGVLIVSALGAIEVGGRLGVEAPARAAVDIDWTPKKGLVLDATATVSAQPTFKFDVTGSALVEANVLFKTVTLYEKKWQLAAVEYGSGMNVGLTLPIHYQEGKPFNLSLSDIKLDVPKVDATEVLKGLIKKIA